MVKKNNIMYIAEIGLNHNGSIDLAKKHIESAKESNATIAKFQTYFTEKRAKPNSPIFEILKQCELSIDDFFELKSFCDNIGIEFASTAFCEESADNLCKINCKTIKIASFHLRNLKLIKRILNLKNCKHLIISTGVSSSLDLLAANNLYDSIKNINLPSLSFLHCISEYPISNISNYNLSNIPYIKKITSKKVGYSDHSKGPLAPSYAIALGAQIIEKHFTIDNNLEGADHSMSADPKVFKKMVEMCEDFKIMLGNRRLNNHYDCERNSLQFRQEN